MNIKSLAMQLAYAHLESQECNSQAADKLSMEIEKAFTDLLADHEMTVKERDFYLQLLRKILAAVVEFAEAFQPIIPQESRQGWDLALQNIKLFEKQIEEMQPKPATS